MRGALQTLIKRAFAMVGAEIGYHPSKIMRVPWADDQAFRKLKAATDGRTMLDPIRLYILYQAALQARRLDGAVAEIGVYRGGSAKLVAQTVAGAGKTVHLFDTFAGMPEVDPDRDLHAKGDFSDTSLVEVRRFLGDCPNVEFHPGTFPETASGLEDLTFSLVHIDVDIYQSVLDCSRFFFPRLVRGGMLVFDDYGFLSCPGAKLAVDEYFGDRPERPLYLPTAQAVVTKT